MARKNNKDDGRLEGIIRREMDSCVGLQDGELSISRTKLKDAYYGAAYGNDAVLERNGWSTHVDRSVMETVEWAKGPLLKVFAGFDDLVRFEPNTPEEEQYAQDATDYVNRVVFAKNAFDLVYGPLTDGLYQRVGWAKVFFDSQEVRQVFRELDGLTEEEVAAVVAEVETIPGLEADVTRDGKTGTFAVKVTAVSVSESIRVEPLPSERVIFSKDAISLETARFVAHWEDRMAGELRADGYSEELLEKLPAGDGEYPETEAQRRVNSEDAGVDRDNISDGSRSIRVYEAYLVADENGDGTLQRLKVTFAGGKDKIVILDREEWTMDRPPIFAACSLPLPYSPVGMCLADLVTDIQRIRSEMYRAVLDNLYASNHGETIIREGVNGEVKMDQFINRRSGGIYKIKGDAEVIPLPVAGISPAALEGLQLTEKAKEQRTGIGMVSQGLSADALQNTATGADILEEAQNVRLEMIARIYAETFFKPMAKYILALARKYLRNPVRIRRKGSFSQVTPADWSPDMDVTVSVGLGTGSRRKKSQAMGAVIALQKEVVALFGQRASPVRARQLHAAASKYIRTLGIESPEQYLGALEAWREAEQKAMQAPPKPSPEEQKFEVVKKKAEAEIMLNRQKAEAEIRNDAAKARAAMEIKVAELRQKGMLSQRQMELEAELDAIKLATSLPSLGATSVSEVNTL